MANHYNQEHNQAEVAVIMVPFIAQGHLNQLLHLSRLISAYGIPVHFISTTTHNRLATVRIHGWDPLSDPTIHFHGIQNPAFQSPPPNPNAATKSDLDPSLYASLELREPIADLIRTISLTIKKVILIHDELMTYVVQDVARLPHAEAYVFRPVSGYMLFWYNWEKLGKPFEIEPEIQNHKPSFEGSFHPEIKKFLELQESHMNFHSGMLYDSSRVIESKYLDLFAREEISGKTEHWVFGPFNTVELPVSSNYNRHECLRWLDKQEMNSVIYVSFGTTTSLSQEEIRELAIGLMESEQKFIWVLREADKENGFGEIRVELPLGFEEKMDGKGIIVRDWAPQVEILGHPSTGGFLSHTGWNSCMESIVAGVPMATWPMHTDQPGNAVLITKVLKIGLVAMDWDRRNEVITSLMIGKVVRKLMSSEEGAELRARARKLSDAVKRSVANGGVTRLEFDSFIARITR